MIRSALVVRVKEQLRSMSFSNYNLMRMPAKYLRPRTSYSEISTFASPAMEKPKYGWLFIGDVIDTKEHRHVLS